MPDLRHVEIAPLDDQDAVAIAGWHYPGELTFYDIDPSPEELAELLSAQLRAGRFFGARLAHGHGLVGFFYLVRRGAEGEVELGLGLRPDLVGLGRGYGEAFTRAGVEFARGRFGADVVVTLRVAQFNGRAQRVYERVGFQAVGRMVQTTAGREVEFVCMRLEADES